MKIIIKITAIIFAISLIAGCNDATEPNDSGQNGVSGIEGLIMGQQSSNDSLQGAVIFESFGFINQNDPTMKINASFFETTARNNMIDAGKLYIDNHVLEIATHKYYPTNNNQYGYFDDISSTFGSDVQIGIEGSSYIDSTSFSFYLPEIINVTTSNSDSINKNQDYQLTWNQDPNNQNGVYILVSYSGSLNTDHINSSLPDTNITWKTNVSDNGSYTISSSVFSSMPVGGHIEIDVGRGNYGIFGDTQKFWVAGGTVDNQGLILK